ncbi:MAG: type III pantothenate kinase [Proteobacteria bacterium]|nr:type III pantothenate kinase [Pseudomonadota bacterium]MBU1138292.1 type III pantothenate kinase [Pseudomonadota bacterium]MBU1232236.1 type III pantothenate kinase [Pseudomonadota bacterium]MBU1417077.1 type III pantothenate kinase [Pseudomonadota bacterium]MBU1453773.1 type III pantothenate kinase [Pseudomonadota bacterium]
MLFTVDVGNSHTVTGLFEGKKLIGQWRLKSDRERTDDELAIRYHALFSMAGIDKKQIHGIILASVVPSLEAAWISCCEKYFSNYLEKPLFVVSAETIADAITISTDYPEEVGADRLVNAIAAWERFRQNLIIIDFGTAITFDCVSAQCEYLGGAILPGIAISLEALSSRAAKLPRIDVSTPPQRVIGRNTIDAMKSGILYGYGALVDGLSERIRKDLCPQGEPLKVIATGGMAHLIAPYSKVIEEVDPMLTLSGLHSLYHRK